MHICAYAQAFCRKITNLSYPKIYKHVLHNYADILCWCSQIYCRKPMQQTEPHIWPSLFSVLLPLYSEWDKQPYHINHRTRTTEIPV